MLLFKRDGRYRYLLGDLPQYENVPNNFVFFSIFS